MKLNVKYYIPPDFIE